MGVQAGGAFNKATEVSQIDLCQFITVNGSDVHFEIAVQEYFLYENSSSSLLCR